MKAILSYGMGVDSSAILLRWLEEPACRDFELKDLTVITAMTGAEFESTAALVRDHVLPRMREHGVRFVQVARESAKGGCRVLDDSTAPAALYFDGAYTITDEYRAGATIPFTAGSRKCSIRAKGDVLDAWVAAELQGVPFRHVIGFARGEERRVKKDQFYGVAEGREPSYPLIEWGWDRQDCLDYIESVTGVVWKKSACVFCPFSRGCSDVVGRYRDEPEAAAQALELEHVAVQFNPQAKLFMTKSVREVIGADGNVTALIQLGKSLAAQEWALYRVRRVRKSPSEASIEKAAAKGTKPKGYLVRAIDLAGFEGTRDEVRAELAVRAAMAGLWVEGDRVAVLDTGEGVPRLEEALVAAPVGITEKAGRCGFERFEVHWADVEAEMAQAVAA